MAEVAGQDADGLPGADEPDPWGIDGLFWRPDDEDDQERGEAVEGEDDLERGEAEERRYFLITR